MSNSEQQDRSRIAERINNWMYRDLGRWDELLAQFHPDATIEVTWFEGKFTSFVDGSRRMAGSDMRSKHFIATPMIKLRGSRAIAETNAMIVGENARIRLGFTSHNRFYDRVEKRDGDWKILKRQSIYDRCAFDYPVGVIDVDRDRASTYPIEYAALGYVLEASGFPLARVFATRNSDQESKMRKAGEEWLAMAEASA